MPKYKINKEKCLGCGICQTDCPAAIKLGEDDKAEVIDEEKLKQCGGEKLCPYGAVEEVK